DQRNTPVALHAAVFLNPRGTKVVLCALPHPLWRGDRHLRLSTLSEELSGVLVALDGDADAVARAPLDDRHPMDAVEAETGEMQYVVLIDGEVPIVVVERVLQAPRLSRTRLRLLQNHHLVPRPRNETGRASCAVARDVGDTVAPEQHLRDQELPGG